ncbi:MULTISPECIES: addiction module protein [unclassified Sulfuricurvum]|uniref:addiction module protein n=1 Tax=unclassified Sulfuricurvum TaxID=2632390 RepID=UPI0002998E50|nr:MULTISPECIES: addiction module protein [unclassified Sulfuricurvum]AFV98253.1 hypothetical protein B649_09705 [Candidatus Sulfuricurvum sp. RIFRC-1]OHE11042.1 MAG: hypothetical protein A3J96_01580 [Sulfurimonas sp. RIFOXYC2_FULL_36_7]HBM34783.1 hypothetical protein [Sulfuricurvum sp.]HLD22324.1 addiction module protein [Sulfuricurvum sp.]
MTMTITVNDSVADKVMAFLNSLPKESVTVEQSRPWYADEVKRRVEEYKSGKMETYPLDQDFWDRMDKRIDEMDSH